MAMAMGGECQNGVEPIPTDTTAELGFTSLVSQAYTTVPDGGTMPLFTGGQGGSHIFATLRITGFSANVNGTVDIELTQTVTRTSDGTLLHPEFLQAVEFAPIGNDVFELPSRFVFLDALPEDLDMQSVEIEFRLRAAAQPSVSAEVQQTVILQLQS